MPTMEDIFLAPVFTKEYIPDGLLDMARSLYCQAIAEVLHYSIPHAWDHLPTDEGGQGAPDTPEMQRARRAWTELTMFPKAVLRQHKRGQRANQSYAFTKALLLRWRDGERESLWAELPQPGGRRKQREDTTRSRQEACVRLAGLNRPGAAMQRLVSPGLAGCTQKVKAKLLAKFPAFDHDNCPPRLASPLPAQIAAEAVARSIRSFPRGAGAGPTGLRADFLAQCIGRGDDDPYVQTFRDLAQLFADGYAPSYLRSWYGGGSLVGVGKPGKSLEEDARPIVTGEVWRRLAFKCTFAADRAHIVEHLRPNQVGGRRAGCGRDRGPHCSPVVCGSCLPHGHGIPEA